MQVLRLTECKIRIRQKKRSAARGELLRRKTSATSLRDTKERKPKLGGNYMLWTIFVILLVLWLLGLVGGYAFGGLIHILLVVAVIILVVNLVSGRRGL
jgi:Flp pilus assembly protein TadB